MLPHLRPRGASCVRIKMQPCSLRGMKEHPERRMSRARLSHRRRPRMVACCRTKRQPCSIWGMKCRLVSRMSGARTMPRMSPRGERYFRNPTRQSIIWVWREHRVRRMFKVRSRKWRPKGNTVRKIKRQLCSIQCLMGSPVMRITQARSLVMTRLMGSLKMRSNLRRASACNVIQMRSSPRRNTIAPHKSDRALIRNHLMRNMMPLKSDHALIWNHLQVLRPWIPNEVMTLTRQGWICGVESQKKRCCTAERLRSYRVRHWHPRASQENQ
mmetsp:Transcript_21069/g.59597  ORF Transcript_21069/g.59597 Transcript_21069/m.59597 type:complete len:270 (+) Transcript_21069:1349-2158(+)